MSSRLLLFIPFICLSVLSCVQQGRNNKAIEERIKKVEQNVSSGVFEIAGKPKESILERMKFHNVRGLSIAVINDYKVEWAKGYGWADSIEKKPVTPETFFQIGSISKSLNAVGVLKLAQDNKLDINKDINNYLTSWKFTYDEKSKGRKITIAQLLSHSAGLNAGGSDYAKSDTLPTMYQILDGKRPATSPAVRSEFEPGAKFQYSNGGVSITMLMISDITKKNYEEYMSETVLKPLEMNNTLYNEMPPDKANNKFATGYYETGEELKGKYYFLTQQAGGAAWSTPSDFSKFIIEMQLSLKNKSNKILSKEMTQKMMTPQIGNVGLGVFIDSLGPEKYFVHTGSRRGFTSLYYGSLESGKGVVIFCNSSNDYPLLKEIANSVAAVYNWKDFYKTKIKSLIAMSRKELEEYDGEYVYNPNVSILVSGQNDRLQILITGQNRYDVFPETRNKFFGQVAEVEIEFIRTNNVVSKLIYKVGGQSYELKKK